MFSLNDFKSLASTLFDKLRLRFYYECITTFLAACSTNEKQGTFRKRETIL